MPCRLATALDTDVTADMTSDSDTGPVPETTMSVCRPQAPSGHARDEVAVTLSHFASAVLSVYLTIISLILAPCKIVNGCRLIP